MKRTLAVKKGERQLGVELERLDVKYRKVKDLLAQALSHRYRFEQAAKAVAFRDGTCWCGVGVAKVVGEDDYLMHTQACDSLFLVLYDSERGK